MTNPGKQQEEEQKMEFLSTMEELAIGRGQQIGAKETRIQDKIFSTYCKYDLIQCQKLW